MTNQPNDRKEYEHAEESAFEREALNPAEAAAFKDAPGVETDVDGAFFENLDQEESGGKVSPKKRKKKMKTWKKVLLIISAVLLSILLVLGSVVAVLVHKGKLALFNGYDKLKLNTVSQEDVTATDDGKTVTYAGKKYVFNENITSVLFLGIDKTNINETDTIGNNGQADAIFILAVDTKTGKTIIIPIVRDTIADVDVYSAAGSYIASRKEQVCLAYAYGDGGVLSCENTVKSVSRLFYGLPINSYAAIDLNAMRILTEQMGGVTLTPTTDFSMSRRTLKAGEKTTLRGQDAVDYIQMRDRTSVNASLQRLQRQQQFIAAFCDQAVAATKRDIKTPIKMYQSVTDYMVTNIDLPRVSYFASLVVGGTDFSVGFQKVAGEMKMGREFAEYYVDSNAVYQTILDVFYKPAS